MATLYRCRIPFIDPFKAALFILLMAIRFEAGPLQAQGSTVNEDQQAPTESLTKEHAIEAETLLHKLGYWPGPVDGVIDERTRHAIIAFQKVEGRSIEGVLTEKELAALRRSIRPSARFRSGFHIEVDLTRQVLFVVGRGGTVKLVLPVSTGTGEHFTEGGWTRRAVTPLGRFTVYKKIDGWKESVLGSLYYPNYFVGGVAIHGSRLVPTTPSTHGCVGIPLYAAKDFSRMTPHGTVIIIYGRNRPAKYNSSVGQTSYGVLNAVSEDQSQPWNVHFGLM